MRGVTVPLQASGKFPQAIERRDQVERRSKYRALTNVVIRCRVPATPEEATIQNMTTDGCMISTLNKSLERGATVLLHLSDSCHATGRVVWADGKSAGIKFETQVATSVVKPFQRDHTAAVGISFPFKERISQTH